MTDLTTTYLGLTLANPLVASASPLGQTADGVRELADAGVGAVVLPSLYEEVVRREEIHDLLITETYEEMYGEATSFFPDVPQAAFGGTASHLRVVETAASAVGIPVIASLNGSSTGGWTSIARSMQDAGAAAIELNVYLVPGDTTVSSAAVEDAHVEILQSVRDVVSIPVSMKLSPYFSSTGQMAVRLDEAGADGLVLFNRFLQPDIDVESLAVVPGVTLSSPAEARLPRTWIAILRHRVRGSLAATTGVETASDVAAYLLAGADVVMTASALLRHGAAYAAVLLDGLREWLPLHGFASVDQLRGLLAVPADVDAAAYERAGYVTALQRARETYGSLRVD